MALPGHARSREDLPRLSVWPGLIGATDTSGIAPLRFVAEARLQMMGHPLCERVEEARHGLGVATVDSRLSAELVGDDCWGEVELVEQECVGVDDPISNGSTLVAGSRGR